MSEEGRRKVTVIGGSRGEWDHLPALCQGPLLSPSHVGMRPRCGRIVIFLKRSKKQINYLEYILQRRNFFFFLSHGCALGLNLRVTRRARPALFDVTPALFVHSAPSTLTPSVVP